MQLPWDEHFYEIVVPAWQTYLQAERNLSEAAKTKDDSKIARAVYDALREGGAASFYVHHFADVVMRARPSWVPNSVQTLAALRRWVANHCKTLRTETLCDDVSLLGDVADALKHAILTHRIATREVAANDAVLVAKSIYGKGRYGEGKFGGIQVV